MHNGSETQISQVFVGLLVVRLWLWLNDTVVSSCFARAESPPARSLRKAFLGMGNMLGVDGDKS